MTSQLPDNTAFKSEITVPKSTNFPVVPVNISATKKGCDKNGPPIEFRRCSKVPGRTLCPTDRWCGRREVVTKRCVLKFRIRTHHKIEAEICNVCRKRQFDQTTFVQHPNWLCCSSMMPRFVSICPVSTTFLVNQRH